MQVSHKSYLPIEAYIFSLSILEAILIQNLIFFGVSYHVGNVIIYATFPLSDWASHMTMNNSKFFVRMEF